MNLQFFLYVLILGLVINLLANMIWKYIPGTDIHIDKIVTVVLISICIILWIFYREENKDSSHAIQQSRERQSPNVIAGGNVTVTYGMPLHEGQERVLKLRVHRAQFVGSPKEYYFINATNLSPNRVLEITHIWYEDTQYHIPVYHPSRVLPARLDIDQSWETFIAITSLPETNRNNPYSNFHARISTGEVFHSEPNFSIPPRGSVPGGPIRIE